MPIENRDRETSRQIDRSIESQKTKFMDVVVKQVNEWIGAWTDRQTDTHTHKHTNN